MPTFSPERQPLPVSELAGPTGKAKAAEEVEAAAEAEAAAEVEAGDEEKSPANANGPTLGVLAWIIQTDARLQPENINVNSVKQKTTLALTTLSPLPVDLQHQQK